MSEIDLNNQLNFGKKKQRMIYVATFQQLGLGVVYDNDENGMANFMS